MKEKICNKCDFVHSYSLCQCQWIPLTLPELQGHYGLATLDDLVTPEQKIFKIELVELISRRMAFGVIITGPTGAGKTHTAISLCKTLRGLQGLSYDVIGGMKGLPSLDEEIFIKGVMPDVLLIEEMENSHYELVRVRTERNKITIGTTNILKLDPRFYGWRMGVMELPPVPDGIRAKVRADKQEAYKKWHNFKNPPPIPRSEFETKLKKGEVTLHQTNLMEPWESEALLRELRSKKRNI
jgi:hypothetical protein